MSFPDWFARLAGESCAPHEWQQELAFDDRCRSRLIRVPTGWGKTLGVLAAWSWHRLDRKDPAWPRRLVWCLPMRVLVEQTHAIARDALARLQLLWDGTGDHRGRVGVHLLMGGASDDGAWTLYPEEAAIVIGTQDMLLSRALNRGYAAPPARWPLEFGQLSHDSLWVMDEVQLMDVGLATSAQLQAYFEDDLPKGFRPRETWWMSATLQPEWLKTVDTEPHHDAWNDAPVTVSPSQRRRGLGAIRKALSKTEIPANSSRAFAQLVADKHEIIEDGEYGKITLVVCNTVTRAVETMHALRTLGLPASLELVHSRFRPAERAAWRERFLERSACRRGVNRIIVATQVVEAGVDISAGCVISELAPWSSLVQRFGRCARYGGNGTVVVVDRGRDGKLVAPYDVDRLTAAWDALASLDDVGVAALEDFEETLSPERRCALYPYAATHLLLRRELDELFDTTPDLTGAHLDIGRFIRSGDERDVQVFWFEVPRAAKKQKPTSPSARYRPRREELCAVPFLRARNWLCGEETKNQRKPRLRTGMRAWVWDWIDGAWVVAERAALLPGAIVCVAADSGGYDVGEGFSPESTSRVPVVSAPALTQSSERELQADDAEDGEELSMMEWKTLACHAGEAANVAIQIAHALGLRQEYPRMAELLELAARWHDLGKVHPAFQGAIRDPERPARCDIAKAPDEAWLRPPGTYRTRDNRDSRPGFRHELASALGLFAVLERYAPSHPALLGPWREALELAGHTNQTWVAPTESPSPTEQAILACNAEEFDLVAYLVIAHHGKVRVALHSSPKDQRYRVDDERGIPIRGVRDGDELPCVVLETGMPPIAALRLTLAPASLGLSPRTGRSWRERTLELQDKYGPAALAWLESIVIAADRRASRLRTADPLLVPSGSNA